MLLSHFLCFPIHWPLVQVNWSAGQGTARQTLNQCLLLVSWRKIRWKAFNRFLQVHPVTLSWEHAWVTCLTFTLVLVGSVLTVDLSVAAEAQVDALPAVALELGLGADRTVLLVTAVVTFGVTVTSPCLRDTVHLTRGAGELLRGTGGRLWGGQSSVFQLWSASWVFNRF